MIEKYFDWKGNEIKAGMIIYFIQTKPVFFESSRIGLMMPGTGETTWEDEKVWQERKNKEIWELGQPYLIKENEHGLFYTTMPDEEGYTYSFHFSMAFHFGNIPTIAIKGISDKKD